MDLYCVMGNPIEHSRSPWIHARFAELAVQTLRYDRRLVPMGGFDAAVAAFRADTSGTARGCNITVPFKFDSARLAQHVTPRAELAQAVNVLSFREDGVYGDNTDGVGLVNDIQRNADVALAGPRRAADRRGRRLGWRARTDPRSRCTARGGREPYAGQSHLAGTASCGAGVAASRVARGAVAFIPSMALSTSLSTRPHPVWPAATCRSRPAC